MNPEKQVISSKNLIDFKNIENDFDVDDDCLSIVAFIKVFGTNKGFSEIKSEIKNLREYYEENFERYGVDEIAIIVTLADYMLFCTRSQNFTTICHDFNLCLGYSDISKKFENFSLQIYNACSRHAERWWKMEFEKTNQKHTILNFCKFIESRDMVKKINYLMNFSSSDKDFLYQKKIEELNLAFSPYNDEEDEFEIIEAGVRKFFHM